MPEAPPKFFLTTPIYYVNARPHIGHAYTTIVADVLARRSRAQGIDTYFLTGTDEHGQKIERSAQAAGIAPQQFTDQVSQEFRTLWDRMGLTYDKFIRTTDEAHKRGVQKLWRELESRGHIYLDSYTGAYCVPDESFVDVPAGEPCPDCGRTTEIVTEENYFFRLSAFQQPVIDLIESGQLVIEPDSRRNEVLSFLRGGLKDLSISRSSFKWGIRVPKSESIPDPEGHAFTRAENSLAEGDSALPKAVLPSKGTELKQDHVIYVWLDALANYMTALGYGSDDESRWARYWPADLHIVGKEIIRFHCVYWPAFLLAAGLPTPKKVVAHGWLLFEESKMSKSKGNIVRTETILDAFGTLCPTQPTEDALKGRGFSPAVDTPTETAALAAEGMSESASANLPATNRKGTPSGVPQQAPEDKGASAPGSPSIAPNIADGNDRKGTPSGVPQTAQNESGAGALAPGSPSRHDRDLFAADVLRYFLLREIPFGQDGSFSFDAMITRYNADLANGYGNLVSRTLNMIIRRGGTIPVDIIAAYDPDFVAKDVLSYSLIQQTVMEAEDELEQFSFASALSKISSLVTMADGYMTQYTPWKLVSSSDPVDQKKADFILGSVAELIRIITVLLYPVIPYATAKVWAQLGLDQAQLTTNNEQRRTEWGGLKPGTKLGPLSPIFPRADKGLAQTMSDMETEKNLLKAAAQTPSATEFVEVPITSEKSVSSSVESVVGLPSSHPAAAPRTSAFTEPNPGAQVAASAAATTEREPLTTDHSPLTTPSISIDDFIKVELRVAQIVVAERIPKADKLLRLEVDLGYEKRQILSGIAEWYTPEELIGRRIVVITNLAPRKMRGLESHGMLLAASTEGGKPHLATFAEADDLPLGSRLK